MPNGSRTAQIGLTPLQNKPAIVQWKNSDQPKLHCHISSIPHIWQIFPGLILLAQLSPKFSAILSVSYPFAKGGEVCCFELSTSFRKLSEISLEISMEISYFISPPLIFIC